MTAHAISTNESVSGLESRHTSGVYPKRDIAIVRGAGARVWDADGREYLDLASGQGVASLGHCHPAIVDAIAAQSRALVTCPEIFFNDRRAELLAALASRMPDGLDRFFLCNSGAEAVEAAIKFSRIATGRAGVVAASRGFHGRTFGALSATWERSYREPFAPLVPGFRHAPYDRIDAMEEAVDATTGAVVVEIVQGEGGVRPGSGDYFRALRRLCDERGAMLVVDEVQTGFGRTGRWLAFEHHGIVPDLVCLGKAIAGGLPMGAVAIGRRVGALPAGSHGSTFGGNPLACAAALAAIRVYDEERLVERAAAIGRTLERRLTALDLRVVREVRVAGAMAGIELRTRVTPVLRSLLARGVIALPAGPTVLRLLPPLVIADAELGEAIGAIERVLAETTFGEERSHGR